MFFQLICKFKFLEFSTYIFYDVGDKRADFSPDGKRFPSPMGTRNTRGVKNAMPAFGGGLFSNSADKLTYQMSKSICSLKSAVLVIT